MKEITKVVYKNSIYFRGFDLLIKSSNNEYHNFFGILELFDEEVNIAFEDINISIISVIDNVLEFSINGNVFSLNKDNLIYNSDDFRIKIEAKYQQFIELDPKIYDFDITSLSNYADKILDDEILIDVINYYALNVDVGRAFAWMGFAQIEKDLDLAMKYFEKSKKYGCYYGDYYIGRHFYFEEKVEDAKLYLESSLRHKKQFSKSAISNMYDYLILPCHYNREYMKETYYIYKAIEHGSSYGWVMLGSSYDKNINENLYVPNSDACAKYCYLKAMEDDSYKDIASKRIEQLSDIEPLKPNIDYILEFEDYILSDDFVDAMKIKIEAYNCYKVKPFDLDKAEILLQKLVDLKFADAGFTYALYFLAINQNGVDLTIINAPIIENGEVVTIKNNVEKSIENLEKGSMLGSFDCMIYLLNFYSNVKDKLFDMDKAKIQYDRIKMHFNRFDDLEKDIIETYEENARIQKRFYDNIEKKYLDNYVNKPYKAYFKKYFRYLELKAHKIDFINSKKLKSLPDDFKKLSLDKIDNASSLELVNNAIYYMTIEYNEKLAYLFAYMAYDLGDEYAKYLLGVIYELGIFTPRANSYAKYFYEMVNAEEAKYIIHINSVKPERIKVEANDFDPVEALIEGVKLISIGYEGTLDIENMNKGLNLIKEAKNNNYPEAYFILGGLYFDIDQGDSRLWDQGSLIHLEANKFLSNEYLAYACKYGHEDALLALSSMHAYKHFSSNKITNQDPKLANQYLRLLADIHQYPYLINLDCDTLDSKFDCWTIRFFKLNDYIKVKSQELFVMGDIHDATLGNMMIAINCMRLSDFDYFYSKNDYTKYKEAIESVIKYYIDKKRLMDAYFMYMELYKLGIKDVAFDEFVKIKDLPLFEVKYYLTN